jgi:phage shock protein A
MGVFTRFRDIISANINSMLDKAEDPEKMIKLMIREMEDTLIELKASCAGIMAEKKKILRRLEEMQTREQLWEGRARMAVNKGRDDLAREALMEKRRFHQMVESSEQELNENSVLVNQYHDDIRQLEDKLDKAREKQRILVQRSIRARQAKQAQEEIRRMDNYETIAKFDELENRIERMEAEADLVNFGRKPDLDEEFEELFADDDIEQELASLKASKTESDHTSTRDR